ncbi:nucleotidyltransferase domain-containing protein [Candidatus Uhrbacteria bacterium]|nr:nucleotidyltransferase domain-containing protein [Candidatus Uhrbacteria bacterium]
MINMKSIEDRLLSHFSRDQNVVGIMVFGSVVNGKADQFSDVDVYVLTRTSTAVTRKGFFVGEILIDVIIDSVETATAFLQQDRNALRRPTSHILANGKIIFERTPQLRVLQRLAKQNLNGKTRTSKSDYLMHAYSLHDFLGELERSAKNDDRLLFACNLQLFINNAIECVLRKHGDYFRRFDETIEVLSHRDAGFVRSVRAVYQTHEVSQQMQLVKKIYQHLKKRYQCSLPKTWTIK